MVFTVIDLSLIYLCWILEGLFKIQNLWHTHTAAAAVAKLLQLYPILCNPTDGSLPGSSAHGIFQARVLEWGAIAFSDKHAIIYKNSI